MPIRAEATFNVRSSSSGVMCAGDRQLSGKFYERFGDDIANELVEWFNAVDSTYQKQLKEINDLNRELINSRFEAFEARWLDSNRAIVEGSSVK